MNPLAAIAAILGLLAYSRRGASYAAAPADPAPAAPAPAAPAPGQTVSLASSIVPGFQTVATWRREVNPLFPHQSNQRWIWPDGLPSTVGLVDAGDSFNLTQSPYTRYDAPKGYTFILPQSAFVKSKGKIDPLKGLRMFPSAIATAAQSGLADVLTAAGQLPKAAAMAGEAATIIAGPVADFAIGQGWISPKQVKQVTASTLKAWGGLGQLGALAQKVAK